MHGKKWIMPKIFKKGQKKVRTQDWHCFSFQEEHFNFFKFQMATFKICGYKVSMDKSSAYIK